MSLIERLIVDDQQRIDPPATLFKYLPTERIDVLRKNQIRLTQPGAFNDPFEGNPRSVSSWNDPEYVRTAFPDWMYETDLLESLHHKMHIEGYLDDPWDEAKIKAAPIDALQLILVRTLEVFHEQIFEQGRKVDSVLQLWDMMLGIVSLSETDSDPLMWAFYADSHSGFVLGLNPKDGMFLDSPYGVRKVRYTNDRPTSEHPDGIWKLSFNLTKSVSWRHEREWRLIKPILRLPKEDRTDALGYPIILMHLPPTAVKCVILGARMSEESSAAIRSVLSDSKYVHIEMKQAHIDLKRFRVLIRRSGPN